ncbi:MAG: flotillin family protein [Thermoanaerobaculaceae bacterium]
MAFLPWMVIVGLLLLAFILWELNYRKVGPNQVLVISGRTSTVTEPDGRKRKVGYRLQVGGGTFVVPFLELVQVMPLDVISVSIRCPEVLTAQGVRISAEAFGQVKVSSDERLLHRAVENFLSRGISGIAAVAQEVLEGHMRAALGTMAVEAISTEREEFAQRVRRAAQGDFERLGLELLAFSLKDISDSQGYLEALGARRIAEVKRDAAIAQAETERDAVIRAAHYRKEGDVARLAAEAELAKANRDFELQRAELQIAVNTKRAEADLAYELARARALEELKRQEYKLKLTEKELEAKVEEQEIALREKHLQATVKLPAEAESYRTKLEAEAEAYRKELEAKGRAAGLRLEAQVQAEAVREQGKAEAEAMREKALAWQQYNQAALAEMLIQRLPEMARAVAEPLANVDKIVMVGEGGQTGKLTAQVAEVLAQLPTVVEALTGFKLADALKKPEAGANAQSS